MNDQRRDVVIAVEPATVHFGAMGMFERGDKVRVLTIAHQRRRPFYWSGRE